MCVYYRRRCCSPLGVILLGNLDNLIAMRTMDLGLERWLWELSELTTLTVELFGS